MSTFKFAKGALVAAAIFGFAGAAQAQSILFVDVDRVLSESAVGQSIQAQLTTISQTMQGELQPTASSLAQEQAQLQAEIGALTPEAAQQNAALNARVQDFQTRAQAFAVQEAQASADLQATQNAALRTIFDALGPQVEAVRAERGASAVLNTSAAAAMDPSLEITSDVIARLNQALPNAGVARVSAPAVTGQ